MLTKSEPNSTTKITDIFTDYENIKNKINNSNKNYLSAALCIICSAVWKNIAFLRKWREAAIDLNRGMDIFIFVLQLHWLCIELVPPVHPPQTQALGAYPIGNWTKTLFFPHDRSEVIRGKWVFLKTWCSRKSAVLKASAESSQKYLRMFTLKC